MIKCSPEAFAKCPIRCLHCDTEDKAYFCEDSDCHKFNQAILSAPRTNADRIRAMSDEELSEFMKMKSRCPDETRHRGCVLSCGECWMEWLQQPAEVE